MRTPSVLYFSRVLKCSTLSSYHIMCIWFVCQWPLRAIRPKCIFRIRTCPPPYEPPHSVWCHLIDKNWFLMRLMRRLYLRAKRATNRFLTASRNTFLPSADEPHVLIFFFSYFIILSYFWLKNRGQWIRESSRQRVFVIFTMSPTVRVCNININSMHVPNTVDRLRGEVSALVSEPLNRSRFHHFIVIFLIIPITEPRWFEMKTLLIILIRKLIN